MAKIEYRVQDPRDRRRVFAMIAQRNMLGKDATAWQLKTGEIAVFRSTDSPRAGQWIYGLTRENYLEYMKY